MGSRRIRAKLRILTKSEQMARVRSRNTSPELLLRKRLWHAGYRYRLHKKLPGSPDISFPGARLAVFVDGCFWHACPAHYTAPVRNSEFWKAKIERNVARDRSADRQLAELGWSVVRVWEHEVACDLERIVTTVRRAIQKRRGQKELL